MFVYFDGKGVLKEIITDEPFRVGDSKRDKIYIYWEGEHSPVSGWIKYRKPNGEETKESVFFLLSDNSLVGKELPTKPIRNLKYFSYDHTYVDSDGETKVGYQFYEITVPDEVLVSGKEDEKIPTSNNLVVARIRFVMDDASSIETLGAIVFSVETNIGILTDKSISETQYNYLLSLLSERFVKVIFDGDEVSARFTKDGVSIAGSSLTLNEGKWGFKKIVVNDNSENGKVFGMLLHNGLKKYPLERIAVINSGIIFTEDDGKVIAIGEKESIDYLPIDKPYLFISEETADKLLFTNRIDLSKLYDYFNELNKKYVPYTGATNHVNLGLYNFAAAGIKFDHDVIKKLARIYSTFDNLDISSLSSVSLGCKSVNEQQQTGLKIEKVNLLTSDYKMSFGNGNLVESFLVEMANGKISHISCGDTYTPTYKEDLTTKDYVDNKIINSQGGGWVYVGKVARANYTLDLSEIKPGHSGTTTGAKVYVDIDTFKKVLGGITQYKTVLDVTCRTQPFELKHLDLKALLSNVGSKWFFPRVYVSRGAMMSTAFTNMMAVLYNDRANVGMTIDEVSIFRDMTTALGTLNASGGVLPIGGFNADGFTLFAVMMELDRDNADKNVTVTGSHHRVTVFHHNPVM